MLKILRAKASVGLNQARLVDINAVNQIIAKPESLLAAQKVADSAVTLVRDNKQVLPLTRTRRGTNPPASAYQSAEDTRGRVLVLIFTDDSRSDAGRALDEQVRRRIPDARVMYIDVRTAAGLTPAVMSAVDKAQKIIVAIYEVPVAGKSCARDTRRRQQRGRAEFVGRDYCEKILQAAAGEDGRGGHGQPVRGLAVSRDTNVLMHFFQYACFRDQRGEGDVWRDFHARPHAGDHSQHRRARRGPQ